MKVNNNKIYIALGSNLKSFSFRNIRKFFNAIIINLKLIGIKVNKNSNIWISNPLPFSSGPMFYNSVLECSYLYNSHIEPDKLLKKISKIEKKFGKKLKGKNKQRVIDIDIIDFKGLNNTDKILLPHPRMHLRKFVLIPLFELNKYWWHPELKKNCLYLQSKIKGNQFLIKSKMFS